MAAAPEELRVLKQHNRSDILFSLAKSPDAQQVYLGSSDGRVYGLDPLAEKPEPESFEGHRGYVTSTVLAAGKLISAAYDGKLIWWDLASRQPLRTVDAHQRWIRQVVVSPQGDRVISVADDMVARVWDSESGELVHELRGHEPKTPHHFPSMLFAAAVSPDGSKLATADKVGHIVVWDLAGGKSLKTLEAPKMYTWDPKQRIHSIGGIRSLAFSPDGSQLACGGIGQIGNIDHLGAAARIEIFAWEKGERLLELPGDDKVKGLVERLIFHPQGDWLLAVGGDHSGFIKFLDLKDGKLIKQDKAPMHVHDMVLSDDCETIFAAGHGKVVVWSLAAKEEDKKPEDKKPEDKKPEDKKPEDKKPEEAKKPA